MQIVLLTAFGVGGATIFGAVMGFIFKKVSQRFNNIALSFAAGVMLAASIIGLILPSLEYAGKFSFVVSTLGVFSGALCVNLIDKLVPYMHRLAGISKENHAENAEKINKVLLFVLAMGIHNLPEGIAAGVGFGTGNIVDALSVAGGIALQNIPEGMVIIAPMLASGINPRRTFIIAMTTGLVEVFGTLVGYLAVSISSTILPFALAFAGGTMMYVICDDMIPEAQGDGNEKGVTYSFIAGFCIMIVFNYLLELL